MKQNTLILVLIISASILISKTTYAQSQKDSLPDLSYTYMGHDSRLMETSVNLYVASTSLKDSTEVPRNTNTKWKKGATPAFIHKGFRLEYQTMKNGTWYTDSTKFTRWNHDMIPTSWHVWNST